MTEGLREFDTTIGRCVFCGYMVLKEEAYIGSGWVTHESCKREQK